MASTSRSQHELLELDDLRDLHEPQPRPKHTIFLCHSSAQKAFVEQLYEDLKSREQSAFFDQSTDSLPKAEFFASRILEAAKQCGVAVVVLSKEFLQSKWAMLELSTFVGVQGTSNPNLRLFPLFYKLEAAELKGTAQAMQTMWEEMAVGDERIDPKVWKEAVRVLAGANGEVFSKYGGSEVRYRKAIVDAVCKLCRPFVESTVPSMVGRDRLCKIMEGEFEKLATKQGVIGAKILGLYGTAGMGKTFICKALCEHFDYEYSGRVCYVEYSDGVFLELLKLILEKLIGIDGKALKRIRTEDQANDVLKRFLPRQDVFLALDNLQGDLLDWSFLSNLSAKSKVVVASQTKGNIQKVVGCKAMCLPCPALTLPEAVKLFLRSAGCIQPLTDWTQEEMEILKECIELSFLKNDGNLLETEEEMTLEEMEDLIKCMELSLISENESNSESLLNSDSSEKHGRHNPLLLVAMGTTIKEANTVEPTHLMNKCKCIKRLQCHEKRRLSDILKTKYDTLTAAEKQLFLDVALFYPIMNLGDVEFVHMLELLINWLEVVDGGSWREILHKLGKLKDFNRVLHGHKVHELFPNIFLVLSQEGIFRFKAIGEMEDLSMQYLNKAIEILTIKGVSLEGVSLEGVSGRDIGNVYMIRGAARSKRKNNRGAVEDLQRANQFYPNHPMINQLLGSTNFALGHFQDALDAMNLAITLYPTTDEGIEYASSSYVEAFAIRAITKLQLNDLAGAKMDINFATALNPRDSGFSMALSHQEATALVLRSWKAARMMSIAASPGKVISIIKELAWKAAAASALQRTSNHSWAHPRLRVGLEDRLLMVGEDEEINSKIIGTRYILKGFDASPQGPITDTVTEYKSPLDYFNGHGTHCASTAAGRWAYRASSCGVAKGTARGMAPKARIAVYKVLWKGENGSSGGYASDIMQAFDQAVADGVDVISISIGPKVTAAGIRDLYQDGTAIAAYNAAKKGIFVSIAGGNQGSMSGSIANVAPWMTTVAATTMDRAIVANMVLGNGEIDQSSL